MQIKFFFNLQKVTGFVDNLMHSIKKNKEGIFSVSLISEFFPMWINTMTLLGFQIFLTLQQLFCEWNCSFVAVFEFI